jgi:DNA-binding XRE family transcriptional regulator
MEEGTQPRDVGNGARELDVWLGAALAIGRDHLGLSLKDAGRELAGVSDKTLMKRESGDRLHALAYAIALARRDAVTRSMLLQALARETTET